MGRGVSVAAAVTGRPLLSKQHSTHPRTDRANGLDVAGAVENIQALNWVALQDLQQWVVS